MDVALTLKVSTEATNASAVEAINTSAVEATAEAVGASTEATWELYQCPSPREPADLKDRLILWEFAREGNDKGLQTYFQETDQISSETLEHTLFLAKLHGKTSIATTINNYVQSKGFPPLSNTGR